MRKGLLILLVGLILPGAVYAADPALQRGMAAARIGQGDMALRAFEDAWRQSPLSCAALYNLGLAHAKAGNHLLGVVYLEAYLAARPGAENTLPVRRTIGQLEVRAERQRDGLFERALQILDAAPFEKNFYLYGGKWQEASHIAYQLSLLGQLDKARQVETLELRYARKAGDAEGYVTVGKEGRLASFYTGSLARRGRFEEAWGYMHKLHGSSWRDDAAREIATSPLIDGRQLRLLSAAGYRRLLLDNSARIARTLWLAGDEQGLLFLSRQIRGEEAGYNPGRLEIAHGLLGLGHKQEALDLARAVPQDPQAPMPEAVLQLSYPKALSCYEAHPRSTLWHMLRVRQIALAGDLEAAAYYRGEAGVTVSYPLETVRSILKWDITAEMLRDKAWLDAFRFYAGKKVDEAVAALKAAGEDVTSFLKIILRHAALTDPRYAAAIAAKMEPSYLGPFLLQEEAVRAEKRQESARAKMLRHEAMKLAGVLGGEEPASSPALRRWLDLAALLSGHRPFTSLPAVIRQAVEDDRFELAPLILEPDFVAKENYFSCPPPPGTQYAPSASLPTWSENYQPSHASEIADVAAYLGEALLYIRGAREGSRGD